jgi:hypothetical protein
LLLLLLLQLYTASDSAFNCAACCLPVVAPAVQPTFVMDTLAQALGLFQNNSVFTLGQNEIFPGATLCNNNVTADITAGINATCIAPMLTK